MKNSINKRVFHPLLKRKDAFGGSRLGTLFSILICVCVTYAGFRIVPFYLDYFEIQGQMQAQAEKASKHKDRKIRDFIWTELKLTGIPIQSKDEILIHRFNGKIVIQMKYEEIFYVDLGDDRIYDIWTFKFNPKGEAYL